MLVVQSNLFSVVEKLLKQASRKGFSSSDQAIIASLSDEEAERLLRRLAAILKSELPNPRPGDELAAEAGISARMFYKLKKRWKAEGSVGALVPFHQVHRPRPLNQGEGPEIARLAEELVGTTPDYVAAGVIAREITRRVEGPNAYRSALRHVRLARLRLSKDIEYLDRNYGQTILCDVTSIRIPAFGKRDAIVPGAAFVIERASRLILSAVVVSPLGALKAQLDSVNRAISVLSEQRLDRSLEDLQHDETDLVLGAGGQEQLQNIRDRLQQHSGVNVIATGSRRFGQSLVSLLGSRLGKITFAPRFTAEQLDDHPALEDSALAAQAQGLLDLVIQRHNSPILDVLDSGKSNKLGLVRDGTMAARLKLIAEALGSC